jgi:hypothetical protein
MANGGWKTASMFRRYAIVSHTDNVQAVELLERYRRRVTATITRVDAVAGAAVLTRKVQ